MTVLNATIQEGEKFTCAIRIVDIDEQGEASPRGMGKGFMLSNLLAKLTGDEYSLGSVEVVFDFDDDGKISQIEILT